MMNKYADVARKIALQFNDNQLSGLYWNAEDGLFCTDPSGNCAIYFAEGWETVSPVTTQNQNPVIAKLFRRFCDDENLCLSEARTGYGYPSGKRKKLVRLDAHGFTAYINPKFTKLFPKHTLYYISAPNKPVVAGLWENDIFKPFAAICPIIGVFDFA